MNGPARMHLLFVIGRNNYYKFCAPLIDEALARNHRVTVLHSSSEVARLDAKFFNTPFLNQIPPFKHGTVEARLYRGNEELLEILRGSGAHGVISLHPWTFYGFDRQQLGRTLWVTLQHGVDNFLADGRDALETDLFFAFSEAWLQSPGAQVAETALDRVVYTGFPELDPCTRFDPAEIRRKYALPPDKRIVLYMALDQPSLYAVQGAWSRAWFERCFGQKDDGPLSRALEPIREKWVDSELRMAASMAAFCRRNDALLVFKSRYKRMISGRLRGHCDYVFYDESFYPATALELMAISGLCVSFYSMSAYEAAFLGKYSITLEVDSPAAFDATVEPHRRFWGEPAWRGFFAWKGVSENRKVSEFIRTFPGQTFDDFRLDRDARSAYVRKYLGFDDGGSAHRALTALGDRAGAVR